jgi:hypothetical protein
MKPTNRRTTMRFTVLVKAGKRSEAEVRASEEELAAMGNFTGDRVEAAAVNARQR